MRWLNLVTNPDTDGIITPGATCIYIGLSGIPAVSNHHAVAFGIVVQAVAGPKAKDNRHDSIDIIIHGPAGSRVSAQYGGRIPEYWRIVISLVSSW
jgi:hypothetical protein